MSSDASGGGGSRFPSKVVIAAATGAVVAAGAAYYIYSKSGSKITVVPFEALKKLKEEGNTHFTQKRYAEAIDRFSAVIDECDKSKMHEKDVNKSEESAAQHAELLATCYQNRAAARQASQDSPLEVISDCSYAITYKPRYGRAYIRRSQLLKTMEPKQALADALAAMHIDEKFSEQMAGIIGELMGALERRNQEDFTRRKENHTDKRPQPITHDQIHTFLHKTMGDDYIRNLYFKKAECSSTSLNEAFECMRSKNFDDALVAVDKGEEPECLLLAARLHYYQGSVDKFEERLASFEKWVSSGTEHAHLDDLKISYALMRMETADSLASLLELFERAVEEHGARPDFFLVTAYKSTIFDSWPTALTIMTDSRLEHSTLSQVFFFTVQINTILLEKDQFMESFKIIAKFEEFVDALNDLDEHKNWAVLALSKIYMTFNNTQNAEVLLKELIRRDPSWAIFQITLANVYVQKSEYKTALEFADKALAMEKFNPEAHLLKQSLKLHGQGNKLEPASSYVSIRAEAEPLLVYCLNTEFAHVSEVLRHISFIDAKITAANSLRL